VIPVDEALAIVLKETVALGDEPVALLDADGRVLAEDVRSDIDMPPFDRAAMDGYALRPADLGAIPARLRVVEQVRAGQLARRRVEAGQAIQIMTGAPVPDGATAIQPIEKTRPLEPAGEVEILAPVEEGAHIARRGSEVREGDGVLRRGQLLGPAALAVLAAVGRSRVRVGRRPRVAILVTGDELVGVDQRPSAGQIRNSNGPAVLCQARRAGADARLAEPLPDDMERITRAIAEGLAAGDVLVVSGGVSAGVYDLVEPALARCGVATHFERVSIKPGAPLVFGTRGRTLVFGLPGNPVSAQVTFDIFVRAALLRLQGAETVSRPVLDVELSAPLKNRSGRRNHIPARVGSEQGRLVARPIASQGSADIVAHAGANALLILEAERTQAAAGERVPALLLGSFLEQSGAA